jgi:hypothetical protein
MAVLTRTAQHAAGVKTPDVATGPRCRAIQRLIRATALVFSPT